MMSGYSFALLAKGEYGQAFILLGTFQLIRPQEISDTQLSIGNFLPIHNGLFCMKRPITLNISSLSCSKLS